MAARETNLVNAFETTLAAQLASGGSSMNLTDDPGVDAPAYFVIDPDNDSNREVVLWSSGTNHAAAAVSRDIDSKHGTDPTHAAGTKVRLAVVKQHIEEAHDAIQQGFVLEDDSGNEVEIKPAVSSGVYTAREVKFIGDGVDIDWTDVDNGTDGDPYDLTFTLDINDLSAGTVAVANDSIVILDADDNASKKESIADLISAIDGTGLTASSGVLAVDSSQAITALTGGDLTIYDDQNNADVSVKLGTSATESLTIQVLNGTSNKTAEEVHFSTATASSTANHGKFVFDVDGTDIVTIDDGGIDLASGKTFAINGSDISTTDTTYSAGTGLTLSTTTFSVNASQAITSLTGGDLTIYEDANNADVSLKMGTSATESLSIEVLNGGSNKTAEEIKFSTATASATANHGKFTFNVDGTDIATIDDGGIDLASSKTFAINGSDIATTDTTYSAASNGGIGLSGTAFSLDIDGMTDIGAAIASGDLFIVDDGAAGTNRKTSVDRIATLFAGGGLTAASGVISNDAIGKQSMWVPAAAMNPTSTNGCAAIAALDSGGNTGPDLYTLDFAGSSANEHAQFSVAFPSYWNESTVTFKAYWTTEATDTDGVVWELKGVALANANSLNTAFGTGQHVDDACSGTAKDLHVTGESSAITIDGSPAAGELCYFNISRLQDDGSDTATEDAKLIGIKLFYTVDDVHEA